MAAGKVTVFTLVQARLGSTRLPRKVFADIDGKSMLVRVMERATMIGPPVVLVIPEDDLELSLYALARNWAYMQGSEEDVLDRFAKCATALKADHVVRVTSDCPFLDVEAAQMTLAEHLYGDYDLTWYQAEGRGVQVFSTDALVRANNVASPTFCHSPDVWMLRPGSLYRVHFVRFSVDTDDDLQVARRRTDGS